MAAPTGDIVIDFRGSANQDPLDNPDLFVLSGTPRIVSEQLRGRPGGGAFWIYTADAPTEGTIKSKIELGESDGDRRGCAIIDDNGDGYTLWLAGSETRIRRVDGFAVDVNSIGALANEGSAVGDIFELHYTPSTGVLALIKNGATITSPTNTAHASSENLRAAIYYNQTNSGNSGIQSFAAEGYTVGSVETPGLPATTILDKEGNPLVSTQVAVTVTAGATTLYDDTPTTDGSGLLPELDFSAHGSEPEVDDEVTWTITAGGITQSVTRTLVDLGD